MEKDEKPPESIAAGVDFGDYTRLGLEKQNLHEQSIISRFRRYGKVAKVKPNDRGQIKYTMNKIQAHVIMFEHDAPYVASNSFRTVEDMVDHVAGVLRLNYVTAEGTVDELVKATLGASTIVDRSFGVLFQWLAVLQHLHPDFADVDLPPYEKFRKLFNHANQKMRKQVSYTTASTDPLSLKHELVAGSDVTAAQQIDSTQTDPLQRQDHAIMGVPTRIRFPFHTHWSRTILTPVLAMSKSAMPCYFGPLAKFLMLNRNPDTAIGPLMDLSMRFMMAISFFVPGFLKCSC